MSAQGKGPGKIAGQWPRNAVKEALKHIPFDYLRHLMPSIQEIPLPVNVFLMAYSSTKWFNLNGRCLVRQEIESVVYQSYGTDGTESSTSGHLNAIHKQVNDPEHITTTILEGFPEITKRYLYRQAARLFKEVYKKKENDMVRQRYDFLKGFVGKLKPIPWNTIKPGQSMIPPKMGGRHLWDEEIYFIGALLKWCMGDKDSKAWESDVKLIVERKCNVAARLPFSIYKTLRDPSHCLTQEVVATLKIPNHENFFRRQAQEYHVECSNEITLRYPARSYPDTPPKRALPMVTTAEMFAGLTAEAPAESSRQSERPTTTTAENFAALTITASAESSRQPSATNPPTESSHLPTGTDLPVLDFDDFLESDAYEGSIAESIAHPLYGLGSEPEEAPPAAGGRSPKGKGRARESTSSESQEEEGSGKGKQAVRKKQRGGK